MVPDGGQDPARSLLDDVLKDKSAVYRAKVYELVVRYKWDVDDPNFLILIATGQMEVFLKEFPDEFETLFVGWLGRLREQGQDLKGWLVQEKGELKELIQGLEVLQEQGRAVLKERTEELVTGIGQHQDWSQQQVQQILRIAQSERGHMENAIQLQLKKEQEEFKRMMRKDLRSLLNETKPMWELETARNVALITLACALALFGGGWFTSSHLSERDRAKDKDLQSALTFWEWNRSTVWDCVDEGKETCTISVVGPAKKQNK